MFNEGADDEYFAAASLAVECLAPQWLSLTTPVKVLPPPAQAIQPSTRNAIPSNTILLVIDAPPLRLSARCHSRDQDEERKVPMMVPETLTRSHSGEE